MSKYDKNRNGIIDEEEVIPMMMDAYKKVNKKHEPSKAEISSYIHMLDKNGDGKITL